MATSDDDRDSIVRHLAFIMDIYDVNNIKSGWYVMQKLLCKIMSIFNDMSMICTIKQMVAIDHSSKKIKWMSVGTINSLVANILQNIFFCVQLKKETHTGLEHMEPLNGHGGINKYLGWENCFFSKIFLAKPVVTLPV